VLQHIDWHVGILVVVVVVVIVVILVAVIIPWYVDVKQMDSGVMTQRISR